MKRWLLVSSLCWASLAGCRERPAEKTEPAALSAALLASLGKAKTTYADIAFASYSDSVTGASRLLTAVDALTAAPSVETLAAARRAWIEARKPYVQTEIFRFYDGPIDRVEVLVNTWPIDESYVEAGLEGKRSGILEDTEKYPSLSLELLASLNAKEGETSISSGYHVIEYLLWGKDTRADGPGDRPHTDFVTAKGGSPLAARRSQYLHLACELLVKNLVEVQGDWDPARPGNYRDRFEKMPGRDALALMVKGLGSLSGPELSGERLTVPYETKDQENEHSCFSDTTQSDVALDAQGIENICTGRYTRVDESSVTGLGLCQLVEERDKALGARLKAEISRSVALARAIPQPFDQAIAGTDEAPGRRAIWATIEALQRQTDTLAEVAASFDLRVSLAAARKRP